MRIEILAGILVIVILCTIAIPIYEDYAVRTNDAKISQTLNNLSTPNWPHTQVMPGHILHIPKQIHLIWLGGAMPQKYLDNIANLTALCNQLQPVYTVNLWTDQSSRNNNAQAISQIKQLKIRDVKTELLSQTMAANSPYTENEKQQFENWLQLEYLTPANYAAIADLLRIEILRQEGGLYLDTDVTINKTKNFTANLKKLFATVAEHGGFSCRKHGHITNNNLIIAAKDPIIAQRLYALVQYMLTSMSPDYLNAMQKYFGNLNNYFKAKKSHTGIQADTEFAVSLNKHNLPAIRILTMAHGAYKLAQFAEYYLPAAANSMQYSAWPARNFTNAAPGLKEMESLFNCYINDNTWFTVLQ